MPPWTSLLLAAAGVRWPASRTPGVGAIAHVADQTLLAPSAFLGVLLLTSLRERRTAALP